MNGHHYTLTDKQRAAAWDAAAWDRVAAEMQALERHDTASAVVAIIAAISIVVVVTLAIVGF